MGGHLAAGGGLSSQDIVSSRDTEAQAPEIGVAAAWGQLQDASTSQLFSQCSQQVPGRRNFILRKVMLWAARGTGTGVRRQGLCPRTTGALRKGTAELVALFFFLSSSLGADDSPWFPCPSVLGGVGGLGSGPSGTFGVINSLGKRNDKWCSEHIPSH